MNLSLPQQCRWGQPTARRGVGVLGGGGGHQLALSSQLPNWCRQAHTDWEVACNLSECHCLERGRGDGWCSAQPCFAPPVVRKAITTQDSASSRCSEECTRGKGLLTAEDCVWCKLRKPLHCVALEPIGNRKRNKALISILCVQTRVRYTTYIHKSGNGKGRMFFFIPQKETPAWIAYFCLSDCHLVLVINKAWKGERERESVSVYSNANLIA